MVRSLVLQAGQMRQFFSPAVVEVLVENQILLIKSYEGIITVMFCAVCGFSRKVEQSRKRLDQLLERVSHALNAMTHSILRFEGVIADFQGDASLAFWGWPNPLQSDALSACRAAMSIWRALVDDWECPHSYQSVRRFIVKLRGESILEAHPVIQTAPGEEGQVDYGDGPMVRHPESGQYRRTRLFVFTLGCSRKSVRLLTFQSSSKIWAELHERAFRRLAFEDSIVAPVHRQDQLEGLEIGLAHPAGPLAGEIDPAPRRRRDAARVRRLALVVAMGTGGIDLDPPFISALGDQLAGDALGGR